MYENGWAGAPLSPRVAGSVINDRQREVAFLSIRKFAISAGVGVVIAALSAASAFAATDPGASACQPAQGQLTATVGQTGQLGTIISQLAPINQLNQQSLFNCGA